MNKIQINPVIGIIVILITILACYGAYRGISSLTDEAFYRGFNTGAQSQKMLDDQKHEAEKNRQKQEADKSIGI